MWFPEDYEPTEGVAIRVTHGNTLVKEMMLLPEENWSASWEDRYEAEALTLAALLPNGCEAAVTVSGEQFLVNCTQDVNAPAETPSPASSGYLPQTGPAALPILLLIASGLGCLTVSYQLARRKR